MEEVLKIALQKSGTAYEEGLLLLKECGISLPNGRKEKLKIKANNFPLEIYFLREEDIPEYVQDNVVDVGILDGVIIEEKAKDVIRLKKLGFAKNKISVAIPHHIDGLDFNYLRNKRIATIYPNIVQKYFIEKYNVKCTIVEISGALEISPIMGLADAICGAFSEAPLYSNELKEIDEPILHTEAELIVNSNISSEKNAILKKLLFRIDSSLGAKNNKYIMLNVPNEKIEKISEILPGLKSPTIMKLAEPGWSALHSVISEDKFWEIIDKLKENGATGILVTHIEKIVPNI